MSRHWLDLYGQWIQEKIDAASARRNAQYTVQAYTRCLQSLKNVDPAVDYENPETLKKLPYFGTKICAMLEKKAAAYRRANGLPALPLARNVPELCERPVVKRSAKRRQYIPKFNSVAYHIAIVVRKFELADAWGHGIGRSELVQRVKRQLASAPASNVAKQLPAVQPALTQLKAHDLLYARNGRYFLSEEGAKVADALLLASGEVTEAPAAQAAPATPRVRADIEPSGYLTEVWQPNDFRVRLLLDNREIAGKNNRRGFAEALELHGVSCATVPLSVGDIQWVAEHVQTHQRAVLNCIVERKALGDLSQSIIDGRLNEQKQRLARSAIDNVIYLIEMVGSADLKKAQAITTAMSQILVCAGFNLHQTSSQNDTVLYMRQLTAELRALYGARPLTVVIPNVDSLESSVAAARADLGDAGVAIDFDAFNAALAKSRVTVGYLFVTMLMAIRGVSAEKAQIIQRVFPTPHHLWTAYKQCADELERQNLVHTKTAALFGRKRISVDLSSKIYSLWGRESRPNSLG